MAFSLAPLLVHSSSVPREARAALVAASLASPEDRITHLTSAARVLYQQASLDCEDAQELVGLPPCPC